MAPSKPFMIRIDAKVLDAMKRWADDELRSLNGQIEWVLRQALREQGRLARSEPPAPVAEESEDMGE